MANFVELISRAVLAAEIWWEFANVKNQTGLNIPHSHAQALPPHPLPLQTVATASAPPGKPPPPQTVATACAPRCIRSRRKVSLRKGPPPQAPGPAPVPAFDLAHVLARALVGAT
jgi:hypothetical protein